jgi:sterol desaturase/sphingolipid hydroxylase (fatty acid hydroxylase superfamily)
MLTNFSLILIAWFAQHVSLAAKTGVACAGSFAETKLPNFRRDSRAPSRRRILANTGFFVLWALTVAVFSALVVYGLSVTSLAHWGLLRNVGLPDAAKIAISFVVLDLTNYFVHRMEHAIPFARRFHGLHHSDSFLDFSTAVRKHPVSGLFTSSCFLIVILGFGIAPISVFVYNLFGDGVGFLAHSSFAYFGGFNRFLQRLRIVAPDDHKIHHSNRPEESDSNFGQVFSLWDRTFGTYRTRTDIAAIEFGRPQWGGGRAVDPAPLSAPSFEKMV